VKDLAPLQIHTGEKSEGPSAFKTFCPNHLESILKVHKKAKVTFTQRVRVEVKKGENAKKLFKNHTFCDIPTK